MPVDLRHLAMQFRDGNVTGATVRSAREALGLSQSQLAAILDVATETVCRWETGRWNPPRPAQLAMVTIVEDTLRSR